MNFSDPPLYFINYFKNVFKKLLQGKIENSFLGENNVLIVAFYILHLYCNLYLKYKSVSLEIDINRNVFLKLLRN